MNVHFSEGPNELKIGYFECGQALIHYVAITNICKKLMFNSMCNFTVICDNNVHKMIFWLSKY